MLLLLTVVVFRHDQDVCSERINNNDSCKDVCIASFETLSYLEVGGKAVLCDKVLESITSLPRGKSSNLCDSCLEK